MIILPGSTILLLIAYIIFIKVNTSSQVSNTTEQQASTMMSFHSLDFTEDNILKCLNEENVIGSGGSGKISCIDITDSGSKVAAKRMWNNRSLSYDLEKQFTAEVEILGKIRHANVVKLLCCVSTQDFKLLIYEYMENQSLDRWLSMRKRRQEASQYHIPVLDWPKRLDIAIRAAKGLCYMHQHCSPPMIHRDIKSRNILLDAEFNAKIADFGLAKMALQMGEPYIASAVAGSFGYLAPGYLRTRKLEEKIDIYSFGVVLLELATGKDPCKGNDHLNLADWAWKHYCDNHPIVDALD